MWLTYALGGDAVSFWLWRAHWAGQEMLHGSLIYHWGDERANTSEIRRVAAEMKIHADWLRATKPKPASVAIIYSVPMQWQFEAGPMANDFAYDAAISAFHQLIAESGVPRDVIMPGADWRKYETVYSPYLTAIDDATQAKLEKYVEGGGTWVLGPLSACYTVEATGHRDAAYGAAFEKWLGVHVRHRMSPGAATLQDADGRSSGCRWWCDAYETTGNQRVLACYAGGQIDGFAAVVECPIGQGRVILLGTQPGDAWLRDFIQAHAPKPAVIADAGVVVIDRVTADGQPADVIVVNTLATAAKYQLPGGAAEKLEGYGVQLLPQNNRTMK